VAIGKKTILFCEVKPKTGRFHQIKEPTMHIGLPIIGDEKYGSDQKYLPLSICSSHGN
jgi:23S rRNA pseudouridine1911/1915/1917 synthase